jgi:hypothetical protein
MKNSIKIIIIALLLFSTTFSKAQSFQKGTIDIDLGIGFAFYATQFNWTNTNIGVNDHAATWVVPFSFEYGVGNRIGIGLDIVSDTYINGNDTAGSNDHTSAHSTEFAVFGNYHFVRTDHIDFYGGLTLGASSLTINSNNSINSTYSGGGSFADLHFNSRFFIGNHFAITLSLRFPTLNFVRLKYSDVNGSNNDLDFYLRGWIFGTGLCFKF